MEMHFDFYFLIAIWLLTIILLSIYSLKHKDRTVGGTLTFVVFLSMIHLLQAVIYVFPWYEPSFDRNIVLLGFTEATIALLSFGMGTIVLFPLARRLHAKFKTPRVKPMFSPPAFKQHIAYIYVGLGIFSYFALGVIFAGIPSAQAFVGAVTRLWHVGTMIWLWEVFQGEKRTLGFLPITLILIIWPILTVVRDGFLGFGIVPTIIVLIFIAFRVSRARYVILVSIILGYILLSVGSVYFESRNTIRRIVWNSEFISSPLENVYNTVATNFHWLDVLDPAQLGWIDGRLGYNYPAGLVIERIDSGLVRPANGRTLEDAVLMIVPRILWPEKPVAVGGSELFQYFTGIPIAAGTSVGLSPVVELYANYRTLGVILGFLILGLVITTIDYGAARALQRSDYFSFAIWFISLFGLTLVQDDIFTIVGATISGALTAIIVNTLIRVFFPERSNPSNASKPLDIQTTLQ